MSKFKVGDKFRIVDSPCFTDKGWIGHVGTITKVEPLYGSFRYTFEPGYVSGSVGETYTTFSENSIVGEAAQLIQDDEPKPLTLEERGGILIEREEPKPQPAPKMKSIKVGLERFHVTAKPASGCVGWGYRSGDKVDPYAGRWTPAQARAFGQALIEMADQTEGKVSAPVENRSVPAVAELSIGAPFTFDGTCFVMGDGGTRRVYHVTAWEKQTVKFLEDCLAIARSKAADRD